MIRVLARKLGDKSRLVVCGSERTLERRSLDPGGGRRDAGGTRASRADAGLSHRAARAAERARETQKEKRGKIVPKSRLRRGWLPNTEWSSVISAFRCLLNHDELLMISLSHVLLQGPLIGYIVDGKTRLLLLLKIGTSSLDVSRSCPDCV